jgi:hypothetical protein
MKRRMYLNHKFNGYEITVSGSVYQREGGRLRRIKGDRARRVVAAFQKQCRDEIEENNKKMADLIGEKCGDCGGAGCYAHQHGEADIEQVQCQRCNGTGCVDSNSETAPTRTEKHEGDHS